MTQDPRYCGVTLSDTAYKKIVKEELFFAKIMNNWTMNMLLFNDHLFSIEAWVNNCSMKLREPTKWVAGFPKENTLRWLTYRGDVLYPIDKKILSFIARLIAFTALDIMLQGVAILYWCFNNINSKTSQTYCQINRNSLVAIRESDYIYDLFSKVINKN